MLSVKPYYIFLFLLLHWPGQILAAKSDLLYLNNGNVITGEIKKMEFGVLTFGTDDIGTISINWEDVRQLKSANQFELTLSNNKVFAGSIDTSSNKRELILITGKDEMDVSMDKLVKIVLIKNSFLSRLDGNLNLGFSYSRGTRFIRLNASGEVRYRSLHDQISLSGNSNIGWDKRQEDTVILTLKQDMQLSYSRFFNKRWYVQGFFGLDQNTELGLKLRISLGAAGGKELFQNKLHDMKTGIGLLGTRETPVSGNVKYSGESIFLIDYRIYKRSYPKVMLTTNIYTIPSLSNLGRVRISSQTNLNFEFVKDFIIGINTYQNFDNRPATEGASKYDWGITASVGYSF